MREMTPDEIAYVLAHGKWATICTVTPENTPYAIEATPYHEAGDICFMINPRGSTWCNLQTNPNVLVKTTLTSRSLSWWAGVSCLGIGRFDPDPEAIIRGFQRLGTVMGTDYTEAGRKHSRNPERSPLLRIAVGQSTGRCSAGSGEPLTGRAETIQEPVLI